MLQYITPHRCEIYLLYLPQNNKKFHDNTNTGQERHVIYSISSTRTLPTHIRSMKTIEVRNAMLIAGNGVGAGFLSQ